MDNTSRDLRNLNLIRLAAAFQVLVRHTVEHMQISLPAPVETLLDIVPGVPIFFAISGFLIYQTYARQHSIWDFYRNRALRIYPALIVSFVVSVAAVFSVGYLTDIPSGFGLWVAAQLTCVQFYNPDFMRGFGVGVLNGSLWTISVELQFYAITPLLYLIGTAGRKYLWLLLLPLIALNVWHGHAPDGFANKLLGVTFLPWLYMFVAGALLAQRPRAVDYLKSRPWLIVPYIATAYFADGYTSFGNKIDPLFFTFLMAAVFSLASYHGETVKHLMHDTDVSYGLYIYHMPVINVLLFLGVTSLPAVVLLSFALAAASWQLVEKPALRAKKNSSYPIGHSDSAGASIITPPLRPSS